MIRQKETKKDSLKLILCCEHGGNSVPKKYKKFFTESALASHRGWDKGAYDLFKFVARSLADMQAYSLTSRLVVDLNRSKGNPAIFSDKIKKLELQEKKKILAKYYEPYRSQVQESIQKFLKKGNQVWHISVHTFTPVMNEVIRKADLAILFDPGREEEKSLALSWRREIQMINPKLKVRLNYPYKGISDGFSAYLRKIFPKNYLGLELEVNQKFCKTNRMDKEMILTLHDSLKRIMQKTNGKKLG
jgi:predicted N-formylglutamate amidohydrolase